MKILLDMNIPLKYAALLTERGVPSLSWSDVGSPRASDSEIMAYAHEKNYVILTYDLDFSAILSVTRENKPSIVQIRASLIQAEQAVDLVVSALLKNADDINKGAVLSIDIKKSRLRLLAL